MSITKKTHIAEITSVIPSEFGLIASTQVDEHFKVFKPEDLTGTIFVYFFRLTVDQDWKWRCTVRGHERDADAIRM